MGLVAPLDNETETTFTIDGMVHQKDFETCDCDPHVEKECECGATMHWQPIYGGYIRQCGRCGKCGT